MTKKQIFISAAVFIGFFILLKVGLLWKNANTIHIYTTEEQNRINSETTSDSVEFIYTEQEQRDIAKWKNKTMDDLVMDAMNGDRTALHNLGECFFLGLDFPIDVQRANTFFASSASLGFAPALNQISQMYINDESNAFLGLVYKNLTISFGHTEFTRVYHDFRSKILENSAKNGQRILNEIEKIAAQKKVLILKNQKYVQDKQNNKEACWLSLKNITDEDYQYDNDYWLDVYNDDNEKLDFSEIKGRDNIYLDKLHGIYYQAITADNKDFDLEIQEIIKEMKNDLYSNLEIEILKKQAKSQAKKNYKFVCKIENDAKEAKNNIKMLEQYEDSI